MLGAIWEKICGEGEDEVRPVWRHLPPLDGRTGGTHQLVDAVALGITLELGDLLLTGEARRRGSARFLIRFMPPPPTHVKLNLEWLSPASSVMDTTRMYGCCRELDPLSMALPRKVL
jgi:hypothetical protein